MADRRLLRRAGLAALAVALILCFAGVFQHGLWTPDEPREAEIGREMLESGFSAMPTLGGEPFLEKPPLYAWITAASYSVFGVSVGAARVPAALFSVGAILVAYFLGKRAVGRLAGLCSAVVLATMWQFSETSHKAVLDTALTFFVAAGHLAFDAARRRGVVPYVVIALTSGLAFLTKSWIGPGLLCAPPILAAAAMRDWEYVKRVLPRAFVASVLGVALLGGPWVLALANTPGGGWGAVRSCLVDESIGRSVGGAATGKRGHANPFWYYGYTALVVLLPWCLAIPAMVKGGVLSRTWRGGRALWCALVFAAGVALLSIPSGKRDLYLVPLMPAAAAAAGVWLSRVGSRRGGAWDLPTCRGLTTLAWIVAAVLVGAVAWMAFGGRVPGDPPTVAALAEGVSAFGPGAIVVGIASLAAAFWLRRVRRVTPTPPLRAAWALLVLFALLHAALRPMLDPSRDMSAGSLEVAALVPAEERFVAFDADETTLGTVPFHTRRLLLNIPEPSDAERERGAPSASAKALAQIGDGTLRWLVVMDKDVRKMAPALKKRLDLVRTVRLSATREVSVYALKP